MPKLKLLAPIAALAVGAVSMVGIYAFADTKAPAASTPAQVQTQSVQADDHNRGADIEVNDDAATTTVSDTDKETNDDGAQAQLNDQQDPGQTDGEVNDGN